MEDLLKTKVQKIKVKKELIMTRAHHYKKIAMIKQFVLENFKITEEELLNPDYYTIKPILAYVFLIHENYRDIPDDVLFRNVRIGRKYFKVFYFSCIKLAEADQEFSDLLIKFNQLIKSISATIEFIDSTNHRAA